MAEVRLHQTPHKGWVVDVRFVPKADIGLDSTVLPSAM
jgi:hypothetical protein